MATSTAATQSDGDPRHSGGDPGAILAASEFLLERGIYGVVWLDDELVVRDRRGCLVEFVTVGAPVGHAILHLYGYEPQMRELKAGVRRRFELSKVAMLGPDGSGPRLNFYMHWVASTGRYLLIVALTTTGEGFEAELENEARRRTLAEAKTVEQAREIAQKNIELTRANRELSEFASVISHDLKSPMRALRYQAEDIEQALDRDDREATRHAVDNLKRQTRRMSRMLTDLLAYARIGRNEEAIEATDTRALAEAIVSSLPHGPGFRVELAGQWPIMEIAAAPLDLVLRNLIDNAIKHHDRPDGRVLIEAAPAGAGDALELAVADDGPGIPQRSHAAVFHPFRKLAAMEPGEAPDNVSGSGIGLALVRKTVETVGARLALQSDPEVARGTVFRLTWPGRIV